MVHVGLQARPTKIHIYQSPAGRNLFRKVFYGSCRPKGPTYKKSCRKGTFYVME